MITMREEDIDRHRAYICEIMIYANQIAMYNPRLSKDNYKLMPKRLGTLTSLLEYGIYLEDYSFVINFCLKGLMEILEMTPEEIDAEFGKGYNMVEKSIPTFADDISREKAFERLDKCRKIIKNGIRKDSRGE